MFLHNLTRSFAAGTVVLAACFFQVSSAQAQAVPDVTNVDSPTNCDALDGTNFQINFPTSAVISRSYWRRDTYTLFDSVVLADTDLLTVGVRVAGANNDELYVESSATIGTKTIAGFSSQPMVNNPSDTGSFDPDGDQSGLVLQIDTTFDLRGNDIEGNITYTISCSSSGDIYDPASAVSTNDVVTAFLNERMHRMLEDGPTRAKRVRDRLSPLSGEASEEEGEAAPFSFSAGPDRGNAYISLGRLTKVSPADFPVERDLTIPQAPPTETHRSCWDIWAEARYANWSDAGERNGDFVIGYLGIDCVVHSSVLVGVMAQIDWTNDDIGIANSSTEGTGWMIGPYAVARLTPNLYLDVRGAWGQSDNSTDVAGVTADFDTERWLVTARLSGNLRYDRFRITPEVEIAYMEERQDSYVDSTGTTVAAQTVNLGRLSFGPEIATRYELASGIFVEPQAAIRGLWDFEPTKDVLINGITYSTGEFRGVAEIGVLTGRPDGFNFEVSLKYDGIGLADYNAWGAKAYLSIPLN